MAFLKLITQVIQFLSLDFPIGYQVLLKVEKLNNLARFTLVSGWAAVLTGMPVLLVSSAAKDVGRMLGRNWGCCSCWRLDGCMFNWIFCTVGVTEGRTRTVEFFSRLCWCCPFNSAALFIATDDGCCWWTKKIKIKIRLRIWCGRYLLC